MYCTLHTRPSTTSPPKKKQTNKQKHMYPSPLNGKSHKYYVLCVNNNCTLRQVTLLDQHPNVQSLKKAEKRQMILFLLDWHIFSNIQIEWQKIKGKQSNRVHIESGGVFISSNSAQYLQNRQTIHNPWIFQTHIQRRLSY